MSFDISTMRRDPKRVANAFKITADNIVTLEPVKVMFPSRYINRSLVTLGSEVKLFGVFATIVGNYYSVSIIPTFLTFTPWEVTTVDVDGVEYTELSIEKDTSFVTSRTVSRIDTILYEFFDEFLIKARVPWFISYEDIPKIVGNMGQYSDSRIGDDRPAIDAIVSFSARLKSDMKKLLRYAKNPKKEAVKFVAIDSVYYSFNNTLNRLVGSHSDQGIVASLTDKTDEANKIEELLRT